MNKLSHNINDITVEIVLYSSFIKYEQQRPSILKLVLRVEWNETVRTCRDPFDTKKFSNLSPEISVEWIAPQVLVTMISLHLI